MRNRTIPGTDTRTMKCDSCGKEGDSQSGKHRKCRNRNKVSSWDEIVCDSLGKPTGVVRKRISGGGPVGVWR